MLIDLLLLLAATVGSLIIGFVIGHINGQKVGGLKMFATMAGQVPPGDGAAAQQILDSIVIASSGKPHSAACTAFGRFLGILTIQQRDTTREALFKAIGRAMDHEIKAAH